MPGCAHIAGSLHMTTQTTVLTETLKALRSDLCWCSYNIFSTQYHTVDVITHDESAAVFSWKVESLKDYWGCILNTLIWPEGDVKGHIPELVVDGGGDMTLIIHDDKKAEDLFFKDGTIPDTSSTDNAEFNILQTIIKRQIEGGDMDSWKNCQYVFGIFWGELNGSSPYVHNGEDMH